jgi:hypothetical protein
MRGGLDQRELLRMFDREKIEIHVGDDVGGRRRFRGRVDVSVAAAEHQR